MNPAEMVGAHLLPGVVLRRTRQQRAADHFAAAGDVLRRAELLAALQRFQVRVAAVSGPEGLQDGVQRRLPGGGEGQGALRAPGAAGRERHQHGSHHIGEALAHPQSALHTLRMAVMEEPRPAHCCWLPWREGVGQRPEEAGAERQPVHRGQGRQAARPLAGQREGAAPGAGQHRGPRGCVPPTGPRAAGSRRGLAISGRGGQLVWPRGPQPDVLGAAAKQAAASAQSWRKPHGYQVLLQRGRAAEARHCGGAGAGLQCRAARAGPVVQQHHDGRRHQPAGRTHRQPHPEEAVSAGKPRGRQHRADAHGAAALQQRAGGAGPGPQPPGLQLRLLAGGEPGDEPQPQDAAAGLQPVRGRGQRHARRLLQVAYAELHTGGAGAGRQSPGVRLGRAAGGDRGQEPHADTALAEGQPAGREGRQGTAEGLSTLKCP
mmetsp:Transcript_18444/g.25391  ORF Transcript_18444/g.25391 Transcript_18444/m.25391 type:complete len:432 (+) Transcript_18444:1112-2407(+)